MYIFNDDDNGLPKLLSTSTVFLEWTSTLGWRESALQIIYIIFIIIIH